jgi:hypothetical protein
MKDGKPGLLQRSLRAIQGAVLGKSSSTFLEHLTGSEEYWNRVLAAQEGWPRQRAPGVGGVALLKQEVGSKTGSQN